MGQPASLVRVNSSGFFWPCALLVILLRPSRAVLAARCCLQDVVYNTCQRPKISISYRVVSNTFLSSTLSSHQSNRNSSKGGRNSATTKHPKNTLPTLKAARKNSRAKYHPSPKNNVAPTPSTKKKRRSNSTIGAIPSSMMSGRTLVPRLILKNIWSRWRRRRRMDVLV